MGLDVSTDALTTAIPISTDSITAQPRTLFPGLQPKDIEDMKTLSTVAAQNRRLKDARSLGIKAVPWRFHQ